MGRWRGWLWIGFMLVLLILASGVLNDLFVQEQGRLQLEEVSAARTYSETYPFEAGSSPKLVIRGGPFPKDALVQIGSTEAKVTGVSKERIEAIVDKPKFPGRTKKVLVLLSNPSRFRLCGSVQIAP